MRGERKSHRLNEDLVITQVKEVVSFRDGQTKKIKGRLTVYPEYYQKGGETR